MKLVEMEGKLQTPVRFGNNLLPAFVRAAVSSALFTGALMDTLFEKYFVYDDLRFHFLNNLRYRSPSSRRGFFGCW